MVRSMADDAIVFPLANPVPEIMPEKAKQAGARIVGTGRSDCINQINNALGFPGVFRGALDVRAKDINEEMKLAAANALAALVPEPSEDMIIPGIFDPSVAPSVASAVAKAAMDSGVARLRINPEDVAEHTRKLVNRNDYNIHCGNKKSHERKAAIISKKSRAKPKTYRQLLK
jgi:malate dehydrogenase (oxaloacetate-decarboxylating)